MSLMLVHGELETTLRVSVCFNLLINDGFFCYGTHTLEFLLFLVCRSNLRRMRLQGLIVFAGGLPEDPGSALLDLYLWEFCFSLVFSPL